MVAAHLAERAWAVMARGMPYVICDVDGTERYTVPPEVRARRRGRKPTAAGKAPHQGHTGPGRSGWAVGLYKQQPAGLEGS